MQNCEDIDIELSAYHDGALPATERSAVESHLAACGTCRQSLAEIQHVHQSLAQLKKFKAPGALKAKIRGQIVPEQQPIPKVIQNPRLMAPARYGWVWGVGMAAALMITLMGYMTFFQSDERAGGMGSELAQNIADEATKRTVENREAQKNPSKWDEASKTMPEAVARAKRKTIDRAGELQPGSEMQTAHPVPMPTHSESAKAGSPGGAPLPTDHIGRKLENAEPREKDAHISELRRDQSDNSKRSLDDTKKDAPGADPNSEPTKDTARAAPIDPRNIAPTGSDKQPNADANSKSAMAYRSTAQPFAVPPSAPTSPLSNSSPDRQRSAGKRAVPLNEAGDTAALGALQKENLDKPASRAAETEQRDATPLPDIALKDMKQPPIDAAAPPAPSAPSASAGAAPYPSGKATNGQARGGAEYQYAQTKKQDGGLPQQEDLSTTYGNPTRLIVLRTRDVAGLAKKVEQFAASLGSTLKYETYGEQTARQGASNSKLYTLSIDSARLETVLAALTAMRDGYAAQSAPAPAPALAADGKSDPNGASQAPNQYDKQTQPAPEANRKLTLRIEIRTEE